MSFWSHFQVENSLNMFQRERERERDSWMNEHEFREDFEKVVWCYREREREKETYYCWQWRNGIVSLVFALFWIFPWRDVLYFFMWWEEDMPTFSPYSVLVFLCNTKICPSVLPSSFCLQIKLKTKNHCVWRKRCDRMQLRTGHLIASALLWTHRYILTTDISFISILVHQK